MIGYDDGALMKPGLVLVVNVGRHSECVLTRAQWERVSRD